MVAAEPGHHEIVEGWAPSADERSALVDRREELISALRGADQESARRRVAKLFGMMPVWGLDAETTAGLVSDYAKLLSSQPLWAIDASCIAILRSGAKFRPGAPEFLALVRKAADPFRAELHDVNLVQDARIVREPDPNERERVLARFREITGNLAPNLDMDAALKRPRPETPQESRERVAEGFPHLREPLTVSDRLRAQNVGRASAEKAGHARPLVAVRKGTPAGEAWDARRRTEGRPTPWTWSDRLNCHVRGEPSVFPPGHQPTGPPE